tara:strand:- start:3862 stop:4242 length:381 start_codon:yes stop_codon:yes gene_type:complete
MAPANPYPMWRMSSDSDDKPLPYKVDDIYESKQDKRRKFYDEYYNEKSWKERNDEHQEEVRQKYFGDVDLPSATDDIHPVFKIKRSSSEEDFKIVYRKLILKSHPDKGGNPELFIKIQNAYKSLIF